METWISRGVFYFVAVALGSTSSSYAGIAAAENEGCADPELSGWLLALGRDQKQSVEIAKVQQERVAQLVPSLNYSAKAELASRGALAVAAAAGTAIIGMGGLAASQAGVILLAQRGAAAVMAGGILEVAGTAVQDIVSSPINGLPEVFRLLIPFSTSAASMSAYYYRFFRGLSPSVADEFPWIVTVAGGLAIDEAKTRELADQILMDPSFQPSVSKIMDLGHRIEREQKQIQQWRATIDQVDSMERAGFESESGFSYTVQNIETFGGHDHDYVQKLVNAAEAQLAITESEALFDGLRSDLAYKVCRSVTQLREMAKRLRN